MIRRLTGILLACALVLGCSALPANAAEGSDDFAIARVTGELDHIIPAGKTIYPNSFTLAAGDIIRFDCIYTPRSASVDFGYIGPDGEFHYKSCTSGSINRSFQADKAGTYTLAIRNNESYAVTVTGTVRY